VSIVIERVGQSTDEARVLIEALEAELSLSTPACQRHGLSVDRVFQPGVRFFIARIEGVAVGCGAVAFDDGFAELKRMYVRPASRGRGVVEALLVRLEAEALANGYRRLTLETGDNLTAALRVYERAGFQRCDAFGAYLTKEPISIAHSVFMEKAIG
jgi:putative acetyltransferase